MRIAIDLNDVVRDYTMNFAKNYCKEYNKEFSLNDVEFWTNELNIVLPFKTERAYEKFTYEDFVYEVFAKNPTMSSSLSVELNEWFEKIVRNIDTDEPIEIIIVSTMEYGLSIQCTLFFLSKIGCRFREYYFPSDSTTIWDKCDVLITANPSLLNNKPDNKKSIKIKTDYNEECEADYVYSTLSVFLKKENNLLKLINDDAE